MIRYRSLKEKEKYAEYGKMLNLKTGKELTTEEQIRLSLDIDCDIEFYQEVTYPEMKYVPQDKYLKISERDRFRPVKAWK